jgi:hypothetical protein
MSLNKEYRDKLLLVLQQHPNYKLITVKDEEIVLQGPKGIVATLFYVLIFIIAPFVWLLCELIVNSNYEYALFLLPCIFGFGWIAKKILASECSFVIDFKQAAITIQKSNGIFSKLFKVNVINFKDIKTISIEQNQINNRVKGAVFWDELLIYTRDEKRHILGSFRHQPSEIAIGATIKEILLAEIQ